MPLWSTHAPTFPTFQQRPPQTKFSNFVPDGSYTDHWIETIIFFLYFCRYSLGPYNPQLWWQKLSDILLYDSCSRLIDASSGIHKVVVQSCVCLCTCMHLALLFWNYAVHTCMIYCFRALLYTWGNGRHCHCTDFYFVYLTGWNQYSKFTTECRE